LIHLVWQKSVAFFRPTTKNPATPHCKINNLHDACVTHITFGVAHAAAPSYSLSGKYLRRSRAPLAKNKQNSHELCRRPWLALGDWAAAQSKALFSVASTHPPTEPQHSLRCLFFCYFKFRHRAQRRRWQQTRASFYRKRERGWLHVEHKKKSSFTWGQVKASERSYNASLHRALRARRQFFINHLFYMYIQCASAASVWLLKQRPLAAFSLFRWRERARQNFSSSF
jgi:hypothetical protein